MSVQQLQALLPLLLAMQQQQMLRHQRSRKLAAVMDTATDSEKLIVKKRTMRGQRMRGDCHRLPAMMWQQQQQQSMQIHGEAASSSGLESVALPNA
jgi:hypothetical protein